MKSSLSPLSLAVKSCVARSLSQDEMQMNKQSNISSG